MRGLLQILSHFGQLFLSFQLSAETAADSIQKFQRVSSQLLLPGRHGLVAVLALLRRVLLAFANQPGRRSDQRSLPDGQRILLLIPSLAASAAALLLRLAVFHLERLYLDEVNITGGFAV